jgi:hypothetical protein
MTVRRGADEERQPLMTARQLSGSPIQSSEKEKVLQGSFIGRFAPISGFFTIRRHCLVA